jgi:tetratricopeptide (TPR) repeat protein
MRARLTLPHRRRLGLPLLAAVALAAVARAAVALAAVALAAVALAAVALAPANARAQARPATTSAATDREARALFEEGTAAYERGELERSLELFTRAYALSPRPALLYNIGNVHDRLRHDAEAADFLGRYLEAMPDAPNAAFVRSRLEVLRANLATEARESAERDRLIAAAGIVDATASDTGIALMVGGGAGLLASIGPIVWLTQTTEEAAACARRPGCNVREASGRRDSALALSVSMIVTSVLSTAGGAALYVLLPRPSTPAAAQVACGLTLDGVRCQGRF